MAGKITFLIAAARAGKSTYAKEWQENDFDSPLPRLIVNSDEIRLALHGNRYIGITEHFVFAISELIVRMYYNMGYSVLVDETNCSQGSIRKWLSIDDNAEAVYIEATREVCYERARSSGQEDLITKGVIDRHFDSLLKLSNYKKHPQLCYNVPQKNMILESIECIRKDVKEKNNA